jgi:hypothetical protein
MVYPRLFLLRKFRRSFLAIGGSLLILLLALAACGSATSTANMGAAALPSTAHTLQSSSSAGSTNQQLGSADAITALYLIKTLKVSMAVKDTRQVAEDLQNWISTTDPRSYSAGADYEQAGNNLYNISLSFSVEATVYPQIKQYLADYASQHGGQLLSLTESIQDVTNDYIDTQSRLTNLKSEQMRLLDLMSHAQALGDVISIQDRLTDVEGQIEQIEAHLKALNSQVAYYTVSIALQPLDTVTPTPPTQGWSIGSVFHDAFVASLAFAQGLLTFMIWVLAFSIYIIPVGLLIWGIVRWRAHSRRMMPPLMQATTPTPPAAEG